MSTAAATQWVYDFAEGSRDMRDLLGGKGANVAEMTRVLGADRVPAGFTITTEACVAYMRADRDLPGGLAEQVAEALARLEEHTGKRLGDPEDPLLVSVRSGARESMPGMLDTVLNLGLNDESVEGLAARTGNERFAWDSYRRFVQMYGNVVLDVPGERFEAAIKEAKSQRGVRLDTELDVAALRELVDVFKGFYAFPEDPQEQLRGAITAVFDSWVGERAVAYRRINRIPDDWGTAVNVQQMVFGNKGDTSGSGVAFSRDEVTGAPEPSGDFLVNAQGEDVVSGVRNTQDIADLAELMPEVHAELLDILRTLERHYGDMQDIEFTVEEGRLYMLQTRNAKRPAQAAVRFAVDAVGEGLLDRAQALATIEADRLDALLHPTFDPSAQYDVLARGVAASPGAAKGEIVFTAADAVAAGADGREVVLVRPFTEADDVAGFHAAKGILTSEGGKASHAALVARGMGVPAVTGADGLEIDVQGGQLRIGDTTLEAGDRIAIDGTTGCITTADVAARRARGRTSASRRCCAGATSCGAWACAPTPTRRRTPAVRASSARRGSGCAAPSTCSSAPSATRRWSASSWPTTSRSAARRSTRSFPSSSATSRASSRRCRGCRSRFACSTRPCTSSCPSGPTSRPRSSARASSAPTTWPTSSARSSACRRWRRSTRCSAPAAAGWASCTPRSTRCRSWPSCVPPRPCGSGWGRPRTSRS